MHDYEVMSRINDLVSTLKGGYKELSTSTTRQILNTIQLSIQKKDEEMAWADSCCLQLIVKNKSGKEETMTFQTDNPSVKKEWVTELRLAQLALDANNSPAWSVPEHELHPSTKMPLFVRTKSVYKSHHQTEVKHIKKNTANSIFDLDASFSRYDVDVTIQRLIRHERQRAGGHEIRAIYGFAHRMEPAVILR